MEVYSVNNLRDFVEVSIPEVNHEIKISTFDAKKLLKSKTTPRIPHLTLSLKKKFKEKSKESLKMVVAR